MPFYAFRIQNTGDIELTDITLTDSTFGEAAVRNLVPGDSEAVGAIGTFAAGVQCNTATVTATADGETLSETSSACYFGAEPVVAVTKEISVDGGMTFQTAPMPPGPELVAPTNPVYRFTVTNDGNVDLSSVTLTDSVLGDIALTSSTLTPGDSETAVATGTFAAGEQCNTCTASGSFETATVTTTASACYFGSMAACEVLAYQEVCLEADIAVDPTVTVGAVTTACVAPPVIRPFGTVTCVPADVPCGFTAQATLCVAVPVSFAATAERVATRVQCQPATELSCLPTAAPITGQLG
jgi:hypothetical protein